MLRPEYFEGKADRISEIYERLENFILRDIARRILKSEKITATADRLLYRLEQLGESRDEIQRRIMELTDLSEKELRKLLRDAVLTSWEDDAVTLSEMGVVAQSPLENARYMAVIEAEYIKSRAELKNLTRTTLEQSQKDLVSLLDEADVRVASGVQSYPAAIADVLDAYAGRGVMVDYPTGTRRTLESAVRCCVVTSMNQTAAQLTNRYIVDSGTEYVLTSAHLGARVRRDGQPLLAGHDEWQGRVFKIDGSEPGYPNLLISIHAPASGATKPGRYLITFSGNVAVPTGETVGEVALGIARDGEILGGTVMRATPAAVEQYFNTSSQTYVDVFCGCCENVSIKNAGTIPVLVDNPNITAVRVCG